MNIDRRLIYLFIFCAVSVPLIFDFTLKPIRMTAADKVYDLIETTEFEKGEIAFLAFDFGPNTKAENLSQAEVTVEHLMRKRIPFALFSLYYLAEPFLKNLPEEVAERLQRENPGETWSYGTDWVNLGYRPGAGILIQGIPKSEDLRELFKKDVRGNSLKDVPAFAEVKTLKQIKMLGQFTGLVGVFDNYVQYFQAEDYRPLFVHGCTSITIPEAYIYLDSGQLQGLFEGIAGAAWYAERLSQNFLKREPDSSAVINTMLGVAHLVIIAVIIFGNLAEVFKRRG